MSKRWNTLICGDEFSGSNGCQICGVEARDYNVAYEVGIVTLCATHRVKWTSRWRDDPLMVNLRNLCCKVMLIQDTNQGIGYRNLSNADEVLYLDAVAAADEARKRLWFAIQVWFNERRADINRLREQKLEDEDEADEGDEGEHY